MKTNSKSFSQHRRGGLLIVLACLGLFNCAHGAGDLREVPPVLDAGYFFQPLPADAKTLLDYQVNARGELTSLRPNAPAPKLTGKWRSDKPRAGLNGFAGVLATETGAEEASLAFPDAAKLLNGRPFTLDLLVRLAEKDGTLFSAGSKKERLTFFFQDRDAGKIRLSAPMKGADGKVKTATFARSGIFENCGPLRRDEFQRVTFAADGQGTYRLWINGFACFTASLAGQGEQPASLSGPLFLGDDQNKSHLAWEIAQLRLQEGEVTPTLPETAKPAIGQDARGWRFDFGTTNSPVEPGWTPVTSSMSYSAQRTWGLTAAPKAAFDFWFVPDRYWAERAQAIKNESRRARSWELRDGLEFASGSFFRVDVPAGRYSVAVTLGGPEKATAVEKVFVNGQSIGETPKQNFITLHNKSGEPNTRTARGLVSIGAGQSLEISAKAIPANKSKKETVSVLAVEILPAPVLPARREGDTLKWTGTGAAPAGFEAIAAAFTHQKADDAWSLTDKLQDPIVKNTVRACLIGRATITTKDTLQKLLAVRADLLERLSAQPADAAARYLFAQTELIRNATMAYLFQAADPRIIWGPIKGLPWREGVNQALQIQPGEAYFGHARLLAGNLLWQSGQQGGGYVDEDHWRKKDQSLAYAPPAAIFRQVKELFPEAGLARLFLGEKVAIEKPVPIPAGCPTWAALEHRAMVRILDVLHYWRNQRMDSRGLMGGGLGDDVEAFRWWNMGVFICDDADARSGWRLLAETYWQNAHQTAMPEEVQDAEHVAEDFSDTHSLLPLLNFGTPQFDQALKRSRSLYDILTAHIMQRNPQGYLMFKSHVYGASRVDPRDGDAPYNIRTLLPLIHYAYLRPDDKAVSELIVEYARSWRDMAMQEIDGKPAGIPPMMICFDRSSIILPGSGPTRTGTPKDWVYPGYWSYEYPTGYNAPIYDLLVAAYVLSGKDSFLDPLRKAGDLLRQHQAAAPRAMKDVEVSAGAKSTAGNIAMDAQQAKRGSLDWVLRVNRSGLATAVEKYRMATGDRQYDDVLRHHGSAQAQFLIGCETAKSAAQIQAAAQPLESALGSLLEQLDYNEALRTELIFNTDRIWVPGSQFVNGLASGLVCGEPPFSQRGSEIQWPLFGVTWQKTGTDVAMLVDRNTPAGLGIYLYNFLSAPKQIGCHLWRLLPGEYDVKLFASPNFADDKAKPVWAKTFAVKSKGDLLEFELPPGAQFHLLAERKK